MAIISNKIIMLKYIYMRYMSCCLEANKWSIRQGNIELSRFCSIHHDFDRQIPHLFGNIIFYMYVDVFNWNLEYNHICMIFFLNSCIPKLYEQFIPLNKMANNECNLVSFIFASSSPLHQLICKCMYRWYRMIFTCRSVKKKKGGILFSKLRKVINIPSQQ